MGRDGSGVRPGSKSSIRISFTYKGVFCRESLPLQPTPANLKRAALHRSAILHAIEEGTFDYATTFPTSPRRHQFSKSLGDVKLLKDYLELWIDTKKRQLKVSTWVDYNRVVANILVPHLGHHTLSELKRAHVKDVLKDLKVTNKRLANIQSVLRSALHDAVTDDILETNPMHDWCYLNKETRKPQDDVDPFTVEEEALILKALNGQVRNLIQFAFWTGMRTSELVALNWGDIDWQRGVICVTRAMTQDADEFEDTKTKAGRRDIKILPPAMEALISQKPFTYLKNEEVFQNPRHLARWSGDQAIRQSYWTKALQLAKVRYRRPYQTRHTYASRMLSAGESPMWVANQMGHSSWAMIIQVYGRWIPDAAPEAGQKAVTAFMKTG